MSGIATAVVGGALISGYASNRAAGKAADASKDASRVAADSQRESLDYLKEVERIPRLFRDEALEGLGGLAGMKIDADGNLISDGSTIQQRALSSPLYTVGRDVGNEAIMRHQAMTGGLRSGNTQDALYRADQALYARSYQNQENLLRGLSSLPSQAEGIVGLTTGIGQTQAAGILGAGRAEQAGLQGIGNAITGGIDNYLRYNQPQRQLSGDQFGVVGPSNAPQYPSSIT